MSITRNGSVQWNGLALPLFSFNISMWLLNVTQKGLHTVATFPHKTHHHIYRAWLDGFPRIVTSTILQVIQHSLDLTNTFQSVLHGFTFRGISIEFCVFSAHFSTQTMYCFHHIPCMATVMRYFHGI